MERIGVRALKDSLSSVLKRVSAGEAIEVTDHGKVVARLVPAGMPPHLARLIEDGEVTPSSAPFVVPTASSRLKLGVTLSDAIIEDRSDRF